MTITCFNAGKNDEAIQRAGTVIKASRNVADMLGICAGAHARAGRREEALKILDDLMRRKEEGELVAEHLTFWSKRLSSALFSPVILPWSHTGITLRSAFSSFGETVGVPSVAVNLKIGAVP